MGFFGLGLGLGFGFLVLIALSFVGFLDFLAGLARKSVFACGAMGRPPHRLGWDGHIEVWGGQNMYYRDAKGKPVHIHQNQFIHPNDPMSRWLRNSGLRTGCAKTLGRHSSSPIRSFRKAGCGEPVHGEPGMEKKTLLRILGSCILFGVYVLRVDRTVHSRAIADACWTLDGYIAPCIRCPVTMDIGGDVITTTMVGLDPAFSSSDGP